MWDISWCENSSLYKGLTSRSPWYPVCLGTWGVSHDSGLTAPVVLLLSTRICSWLLHWASASLWHNSVTKVSTSCRSSQWWEHPTTSVSPWMLYQYNLNTWGRNPISVPSAQLDSNCSLQQPHRDFSVHLSLPVKPQPKSPFPKLEEH